VAAVLDRLMVEGPVGAEVQAGSYTALSLLHRELIAAQLAWAVLAVVGLTAGIAR